MARKKVESKNVKEFKRHSDLFMMDKSNYLIVLIGILFLIAGFALMAGGGSKDPNVFNKEGIYSFRRITLSVIVIMVGFAIQVIAIMRKPKSHKA